MKTGLAALLLAASALPAPASAQPAAPPPASLDLARALSAADPTIYDGDISISDIRGRIQSQLLLEDGSCNSALAECVAEARAAAEQFAPAFLERERRRQEQINAWLLADRMTPAQMTRLASYVTGEDGRALLATLSAMRRPTSAQQRRRRELERQVDRGQPPSLAEARAMFRRNTRNMPMAPPR